MSYFVLKKTAQMLSDCIEYIFANEERRNFIDNVPHYCRKCEILHECRNEKNNWKCYNGCAFLGKNKWY